MTFKSGTWVDVYKKTAGTKKFIPSYHYSIMRQVVQTKLTVFNSSSLAQISMLEAFRLAEGKRVKRPLKLLPKMEDKLLKDVEECKSYKDSSKYRFYNIRRWMSAYGSPPVGFLTFLDKEIERMAPYSKYSIEEMYMHY